MDYTYTDERGGWGSTIGIVIIVVLLIIGGIYFYTSKSKEIRIEREAAEKAAQAKELSDAFNGLDSDLASPLGSTSVDLSEY